MDALLNTNDVARLLRVHPKHVYRLLRRGLPGRRVGGEWRYTREDVLAWVQRDGGAVERVGSTDPDASRAAPPLIAANGDVVIEIFLAHLNAIGSDLFGFVASDRERSIRLLDGGAVIAAGCHGAAPPTQLGGRRLARIHLVRREVGLCAQRDRRVPTLAKFGRATLAARPPSAGIMVHLASAAEKAGVSLVKILARATPLESHRDVVCGVLRGEFDVGLATRAWAERVGLRFEKLAVESYGLLVRGESMGDRRIVRMCEVAQGARFQKALRAIPGYDATGAGEIRYDVAPIEEPAPTLRKSR